MSSNSELRLWDDDCGEGWQEHWIGMPEFVQAKKDPFATIIVRVETEQDLIELGDTLGQKLTPKTKSIWHPHKPHRLPDKKVWVNGG